MNKLSTRNIFFAAALFGLVAESAWAEEAPSDAPAAPVEQATAPAASDEQGSAPAPHPRGYEPSWRPPPLPAPPPGYYGQFHPYYPPYPQYRSAPAAQRENPLSAELKQTQDQLAAKNTELDAANEQLGTLQTEQQATSEALQQAQEELAAKTAELNTARERLTSLQAEQQAIREVMQQAQAETAKASEQLSIVVEEMDILYEVLSELKARLDVQNTSLQGAVDAGAAENDTVDSAIAGEAKQLPSPATPAVQSGDAGSEHDQTRDNEVTQPGAE